MSKKYVPKGEFPGGDEFMPPNWQSMGDPDANTAGPSPYVKKEAAALSTFTTMLTENLGLDAAFMDPSQSSGFINIIGADGRFYVLSPYGVSVYNDVKTANEGGQPDECLMWATP